MKITKMGKQKIKIGKIKLLGNENNEKLTLKIEQTSEFFNKILNASPKCIS